MFARRWITRFVIRLRPRASVHNGRNLVDGQGSAGRLTCGRKNYRERRITADRRELMGGCAGRKITARGQTNICFDLCTLIGGSGQSELWSRTTDPAASHAERVNELIGGLWFLLPYTAAIYRIKSRVKEHISRIVRRGSITRGWDASDTKIHILVLMLSTNIAFH